MKGIVTSGLIVSTLVLGWACKKDADNIDNPYDSLIKPPDNTVVIENLDPNTIQGLQQNIFGPTCANSGCHDGNFEPDFRTIQSSYYSLVLHPVNKNNANNDFQFRVQPGDAAKSILIERLIKDIDGISGVMPLVTEPSSDWDSKKAEYIQNIRNWINGGAKDAAGNTPGIDDLPPVMTGVVAYFDSNATKLQRLSIDREIKVNPNFGDTVKLYFAFQDDNTNPTSFSNLGIRFSSQMFDYGGLPYESLISLGGDSFKELAYNQTDSVMYTHQAIFTVDRAIINQTLFFRVRVNDGNVDTEIPQDGSFDYIMRYFSMRFID
jgi:hypothetical protein